MGARQMAWTAALLVTLVATSAPAEDRVAAKAAYARGTEAYNKGDFIRASHEFAAADGALPTTSALTAALRSVEKTEETDLAAELLERARRDADEGLAAVARAVEQRFQGRLGHVRVQCPVTCEVTLQERRITAGTSVWVAAGSLRLVVRFGHLDKVFSAVVPASKEVTVLAQPDEAATPKPEPTPSERDRTSETQRTAVTTPPQSAASPKPLGPAVPLIVGGAATLALTGAVITAVVAENKHSDFLGANCNRSAGPNCEGIANAGKTFDVLNASLFIGAGVGFATAAILGLFFVDWGTPKRSVGIAYVPSSALGRALGGGLLQVSGGF
jgi:hypothetical protein